MAQVSSRYSDHFGRVCCVVAFRIRFRYVSNLVFVNGASFEPILGSFWSHMLRGCVPDSVSLRFEFSFHEWLKFRADTRIILSRMLRGAFQIRFRYVSNLVL